MNGLGLVGPGAGLGVAAGRVSAGSSVLAMPATSAGPAVLAYNSHNLVRLHVLANSNDELDQQVKMRVRDAIIERSRDWFAAARTGAEAEWLALIHQREITAWAQEVVRRAGLRYTVTVQVGLSAFPDRTYGNLFLPAGCYQAVRVILGKGRGNNWWCVLFPPLCLDEPVSAQPVAAPARTAQAAGRNLAPPRPPVAAKPSQRPASPVRVAAAAPAVATRATPVAASGSATAATAATARAPASTATPSSVASVQASRRVPAPSPPRPRVRIGWKWVPIQWVKAVKSWFTGSS